MSKRGGSSFSILGVTLSCGLSLWVVVKRRAGGAVGLDGANCNIATGGSVAEWLACWTQAQKSPGSNRSRTLSGNSLGQTVHTRCAPVHQGLF